MSVDVLVVGDALLDIYLFLNTADEHCHVNEAKYEMCFVVGAKIPVEDCKFLLGGNACNVSVGLSRLGLHTALAAETGDDEFSQKIIAGLKQNKVDLTFLKQTLNTQASFAVDLSFLKDRTIFSRHVKRAHDIFIENAECSFLYLTSLGEEWKPLYDKVLSYVKEKKIKLGFNPGSKQFKAGIESFKDIFPVTEILFINKEEAEDIIYGNDQHISEEQKNIEELLKKVKNLGPNVVSITDGDKGSYVIDTKGAIFFQDILPSTFVQKTGVGDAYASGFLGAYLKGNKLQECMQWGAINATAVIQQIGAQTGLLTKEQMDEKVKRIL